MINAQVVVAFTRKEQMQHAAASAIVEEVLSSIRTVVAFGGEHVESKRYYTNIWSEVKNAQ